MGAPSLRFLQGWAAVLLVAKRLSCLLPASGLAFVKLDFLIGTNWGSIVGRKQKCPFRSQNRRRNVP